MPGNYDGWTYKDVNDVTIVGRPSSLTNAQEAFDGVWYLLYDVQTKIPGYVANVVGKDDGWKGDDATAFKGSMDKFVKGINVSNAEIYDYGYALTDAEKA